MLVGILAGHSVLALIVMLTFAIWVWFWIPAELAYATRSMIAWSFDGIAPDGLGHVSKRFHTPTVAIGVSTVIALFFMWLVAFDNFSLLTVIEILLVVWGLSLVCAVIFPWRSRSMFRASPASAWKIFGLPAMAVTGGVSLAFFVLWFVLLWRDPLAAGPLFTIHHVSKAMWICVGIAVFGTAWYFGIKRYRLARGIDINRAFREIPIE